MPGLPGALQGTRRPASGHRRPGPLPRSHPTGCTLDTAHRLPATGRAEPLNCKHPAVLRLVLDLTSCSTLLHATQTAAAEGGRKESRRQEPCACM